MSLSLTPDQIQYAKQHGCGALAELMLPEDHSIDEEFKLSRKISSIVYAKERAERYTSLERQADIIGNYGRI